MKTVAEIKAQFAKGTVNAGELSVLRADQRKGVQQLVARYEQALEKQARAEAIHERMWKFERALQQEGYELIAGVDEVGRGPLAGPVVAAACILPQQFKLVGLTDSKQLTKSAREQFAPYIKAKALSWHIASVSAEEIDRTNILVATKEAMLQAIQGLTKTVDHLLLDAIKLPHGAPQTSLIKGDTKSISIAASSVLAKVWRDEYMVDLARTYPQYGFEYHAGYGTRAHLHALKKYGPTQAHRQSFRPVRECLE
ncbi:ribonuclease HII [Shouchella lonarensis]|uniref:Ribonuclease HII n=1 Tax=Shouchella lonarensis TaxID=1464122 RepID=A0A1G6H7T3_9BACI|nr:ribonuclease HII [Shouchella lonarensis]SDB90005.1 RNase HII [Shouchella lonarensis]